MREAILNAVSHRDYQLGGSTFVRQFARRLEIDSPGGLPYGITLENILDRQNPRNRRIAEIFARCGLVERAGQGMNLIFEESIRTGKPVPDFPRTDKCQVGLTLFGTLQNPQFAIDFQLALLQEHIDKGLPANDDPTTVEVRKRWARAQGSLSAPFTPLFMAAVCVVGDRGPGKASDSEAFCDFERGRAGVPGLSATDYY